MCWRTVVRQVRRGEASVGESCSGMVMQVRGGTARKAEAGSERVWSDWVRQVWLGMLGWVTLWTGLEIRKWVIER